MSLNEFTTQKQKLEQEIQRLQKEHEALLSKNRKPVLASIIQSMVEYDISPEEVDEAFHQRDKIVASAKVTKPAPIKYRHPDLGHEWSGRGKAPRWLTFEEEQGRSRDEFLVDQG